MSPYVVLLGLLVLGLFLGGGVGWVAGKAAKRKAQKRKNG